MNWYIVYVRTACEDRAVEDLRRSIEEEKLQDLFGYIRVFKKTIMKLERNKKKKEIEKNVFPGYVFVEMIMNEESRSLVSRSNYVVKFIGQQFDGSIQPLSEEEFESTQNLVNADDSTLDPDVAFIPGQMVRVIEGPLSNLSGVVENIDYSRKNQLKVALFVFGRSTIVELGILQVEKV